MRHSPAERFRRTKLHLSLFLENYLIKEIDRYVGTHSQVIYRWMFWDGIQCISIHGTFYGTFGSLKDEMDKDMRCEILGMLIRIAERNERRIAEEKREGRQLATRTILDLIRLDDVQKELEELNGSVPRVVLFRNDGVSQESRDHFEVFLEKMNALKELAYKIHRTTEDSRVAYLHSKAEYLHSKDVYRHSKDVYRHSKDVYRQLKDYRDQVDFLAQELESAIMEIRENNGCKSVGS